MAAQSSPWPGQPCTYSQHARLACDMTSPSHPPFLSATDLVMMFLFCTSFTCTSFTAAFFQHTPHRLSAVTDSGYNTLTPSSPELFNFLPSLPQLESLESPGSAAQRRGHDNDNDNDETSSHQHDDAAENEDSTTKVGQT